MFVAPRSLEMRDTVCVDEIDSLISGTQQISIKGGKDDNVAEQWKTSSKAGGRPPPSRSISRIALDSPPPQSDVVLVSGKRCQSSFSQSILFPSSGLDLSCILLRVGGCRKVPKIHTTRPVRSIGGPIPSTHRVVTFPCGCCSAGIANTDLLTASGVFEVLLSPNVEKCHVWKDIYLSERLNTGSEASFVSVGLLEDRAKIVNWMSYVCSKLGFQSSVYFLSVNMFDLYVERSGRSYKSSDLPPIAAASFLQAANVVEVGSDGKLPTLSEFVSAAPWLDSSSQVLATQLDMIKVISGKSVVTNGVCVPSSNGTIAGKTPFDFFLIYFSELRASTKWGGVWSWVFDNGVLVDAYHRCLAVADLSCQRGGAVSVPGSILVASVILKSVSSISPLDSAPMQSQFCSDVFGLSLEDDMAPFSGAVNNLYELSRTPTFPLCGEDMGASAPTVTSFLRKLNPKQRLTERLIRHQYRVFRN